MKKTWKIGVLVGVVIVVAVTATVFLRKKPMIEPENNPQIGLISVTVGQDGEAYYYDIPQEEVSDELSQALLSLFLQTEIRNDLLPPPENYHVLDGSVHITVKVMQDGQSMFVNLSTEPDFNSAQFGDTHYQIVDHQALYQQVYDLLSDVMPAYEVKR